MHHNRCAIEGHQWFMSAALMLIPFMTVSAYRILIEGPRHFYTRTPLWTYFRLTSQEDEACVDPSDTFGNSLEQQVCFRDGCEVREGSGTIWQQSRRSRLLGNAWRRHLFLVSSLQVFFRTRPPISTNELFFFFPPEPGNFSPPTMWTRIQRPHSCILIPFSQTPVDRIGVMTVACI